MASERGLGKDKKPRRSFFGRLLRTIAIALFFAFLTGFVIGTFLRREIDKPVRYFGQVETHIERSAETTSRSGHAQPIA